LRFGPVALRADTLGRLTMSSILTGCDRIAERGRITAVSIASLAIVCLEDSKAMEPETKTWWQRLRKTLTQSQDEPGRQDWPTVGEDGLLSEPAELSTNAEGEHVGEKPSVPVPRWTKRDQALHQLQEGYERVNQLIADIQKHMANQSDRTGRMCNALEQLSRSMSDLPSLEQQQAQTLESIAGQLEITNTKTQQLTAAVDELPKAARAQTETLAGINRQLEMAGEHSVVASQTMEKLGSAVKSVGDISSAQTGILTQLINSKTDEQNAHIEQLAASQNKRFMMLFALVIILALGSITVVIVSIMQRS